MIKKTIVRSAAGALLTALLLGGAVSFGLIPPDWLALVPHPLRLLLAACFVLFSLFILLGYVLDSGLLQRLFKKRR